MVVIPQCVKVMQRCIKYIECSEGYHAKVLDYKTRQKDTL